MRTEPNIRIEEYRRDHPRLGGSEPGFNHGFFTIGQLRIVSSGAHHEGDHGWEHVSVSTGHRTPTWEEMCKVKDLFWSEDETVIQFHPNKSQYINRHPFCLHMWKRVGTEHELPPTILIA